jgi:hypothetical protein
MSLRGNTQMRVVPRRRPNTTPAPSENPALTLIPIVLCPHLANLISDNAAAWTAYLALSQASTAALVIVAAMTPRTYRWKVSLVAAGLWHLTQAVDEALAGNLFVNSLSEYVVLAVYIAAIALHIRSHEQSERIP